MNSMKPILICIVCLSSGTEGEEPPKGFAESLDTQIKATSTYFAEKNVIQREYRKRVSEMVLKADRVELFLLDFSMPKVEPSAVTGIETFEIVPFGADTRIIKKIEVQQTELAAFKEAIAAALAEKEGEGGVLCHYPIHGIKVIDATGPIFETSVCWSCGNYFFKYPDGTIWQEMGGNFFKLKELLEKLLPIPPEEMERFKRMTEHPAKDAAKKGSADKK